MVDSKEYSLQEIPDDSSFGELLRDTGVHIVNARSIMNEFQDKAEVDGFFDAMDDIVFVFKDFFENINEYKKIKKDFSV